MKLADLPEPVQEQLRAIRAAQVMADPATARYERARAYFTIPCVRCSHPMRVIIEMHGTDNGWWRRVCTLCVKKAQATNMRRSLAYLETAIDTMERKRAVAARKKTT